MGQKTVDGAFNHGLTQLFQRLDILQAAAFVDCLAQVDEHDDPRLGRHAEAGDESDPYRDAKIHRRCVPSLHELGKPIHEEGATG